MYLLPAAGWNVTSFVINFETSRTTLPGLNCQDMEQAKA
jgi:hypothetical protein